MQDDNMHYDATTDTELTHYVPDHCLHASMETSAPVPSSVFADVIALSMLFLVVLALDAVAFLAAFALGADVFAMVL